LDTDFPALMDGTRCELHRSATTPDVVRSFVQRARGAGLPLYCGRRHISKSGGGPQYHWEFVLHGALAGLMLYPAPRLHTYYAELVGEHLAYGKKTLDEIFSILAELLAVSEGFRPVTTSFPNLPPK
jgi:hypothetical protein